MKKIILIGALAVSVLSSCSDDSKNNSEKENANTEAEKTVTLDDMCECATEMMALGSEMTVNVEDPELIAKFEAKGKECEELGKKLEEGKTEEEITAMKEEFMESCEALKGF